MAMLNNQMVSTMPLLVRFFFFFWRELRKLGIWPSKAKRSSAQPDGQSCGQWQLHGCLWSQRYCWALPVGAYSHDRTWTWTSTWPLLLSLKKTLCCTHVVLEGHTTLLLIFLFSKPTPLPRINHFCCHPFIQQIRQYLTPFLRPLWPSWQVSSLKISTVAVVSWINRYKVYYLIFANPLNPLNPLFVVLPG